MKRNRGGRLRLFGMTLLLLKLVVSRNRSVSGAKDCLPFLAQVLPLHLVLGRHLVACLKYMAANKKQKSIALDLDVIGDLTVSNYTFKIQRSKELVAHMILCHDYPFNIMDH
jgi:hypothetical protein